MTTDEILAGIDRSLSAIAEERERLLAARTQLAGPPAPASQQPSRPPRRSRRRAGDTKQLVLDALDQKEPRTAGEIEKTTGIGRALVATTLSRLVKQGSASKAKRGYLRKAA
jgi:Fic family protein